MAVVSPLMIAIVMGLIADLDGSRSGFLRVDLRSLERVAQDLGNAPSTGPDAPLIPASSCLMFLNMSDAPPAPLLHKRISVRQKDLGIRHHLKINPP